MTPQTGLLFTTGHTCEQGLPLKGVQNSLPHAVVYKDDPMNHWATSPPWLLVLKELQWVVSNMNSWAMLESITSNQDNRTSSLWIELRPLHMGYRQNTNSHMSRHAARNASRHAIRPHGRWHTVHATPYMVTKSEKPYRLHHGQETAPLWQHLGAN